MPTDPAQPSVIVVDIYGNGYNNPPTQRNVQTLPVDPTSPPSIGDYVAVTTVPGDQSKQPYCINTGSGGNTLAKISNAAGAPTMYQIDIYGNGFLVAATQTGVTAYPVDLAAASFNVGDQVAIFAAGGRTWIDTSHPWTVAVPGADLAALLQTSNGDGSYTFAEVDTLAPVGTLVSGGITGTCWEVTNSPYVTAPDTPVLLRKYKDGNWYFTMPLTTCASSE